MPLGISVGERGEAKEGFALLRGYPVLLADLNSPPAKPSISVSAVTSSGATLTSSAFSDPDGDAHTASQWQFALASDPTFSSPVYDSGEDAVNLEELVASGVLSPGTDYIARVRHKD